jgi:hypothetical protein
MQREPDYEVIPANHGYVVRRTLAHEPVAFMGVDRRWVTGVPPVEAERQFADFDQADACVGELRTAWEFDWSRGFRA